MELDELGIDIEAQNCLDQIQQESRTSADYDPSQGMTGEELHNFCKFLYSQIQSKDEEISRLTANIKELTDEVRLSRLQQQTYNDENKAVSASHSQKLDVVLQQLQETRQELTDTKRKLKTAETLLADAKEKNRQLAAEREKNAKERKDSLFFGSVQGALRSAMYNTFTRLASKSESRSGNISRLCLRP